MEIIMKLRFGKSQAEKMIFESGSVLKGIAEFGLYKSSLRNIWILGQVQIIRESPLAAKSLESVGVVRQMPILRSQNKSLSVSGSQLQFDILKKVSELLCSDILELLATCVSAR
jgi:hypothetical protein